MSAAPITAAERAALRLDPYAWSFLHEPDEGLLQSTFEGIEDERPWMEVCYHCLGGTWLLTMTDTGEEYEYPTLTEVLAAGRSQEVTP